MRDGVEHLESENSSTAFDPPDRWSLRVLTTATIGAELGGGLYLP